jgi:hypothetical protein
MMVVGEHPPHDVIPDDETFAPARALQFARNFLEGEMATANYEEGVLGLVE